jgi:hypothetical protein
MEVHWGFAEGPVGSAGGVDANRLSSPRPGIVLLLSVPPPFDAIKRKGTFSIHHIWRNVAPPADEHRGQNSVRSKRWSVWPVLSLDLR